MELFGLKKISSSCSDLHEACPYTLEKVLQKGKCSVRVIKAFAPETNQVVAIKLFPKTKDGKCLQAFTSEQKALANLSHPYILKYHETYNDAIIESEGGKFVEYSAIVMDYISQGDLYSVISRKPFSEKLARSVFKQMVTVVQYLHSQDLMHLDIKLENFLITPKDGIKLIDFEACQKDLKDGTLIAKGTPGYRAPEILTDDLDNPKALDIYSLGIVLFMMVAGTPPYVEQQENGEWKFDKYYEVLRSDSQKFWRAHERYRMTNDDGGKKEFSVEFKSFIEAMIDVNPNKRPKIEELRRKAWFQGEVYSVDELEKELLNYLRR